MVVANLKSILWATTEIWSAHSILLYPKCGEEGRTRGSLVVKALCYKPQVRGFWTRWFELIFSVYLILPVTLGTGVHSASNRNWFQKQENNVSGE
jgi:hypothetical protein